MLARFVLRRVCVLAPESKATTYASSVNRERAFYSHYQAYCRHRTRHLVRHNQVWSDENQPFTNLRGFSSCEQGTCKCISIGSVQRLTSDNSFHLRRKVIAFHTFFLLFFGVKMPRWTALTTLVGANAMIVFLVCLGPTVLDSKTRGPFCMPVLSLFTRVESYQADGLFKTESLVIGAGSRVDTGLSGSREFLLRNVQFVHCGILYILSDWQDGLYDRE